ncbi:hypothetical protein TWF696_007994 [Orbilia brochopaga]|uniref:Uncharacterized protein n=1 Tax=Orbilia brochopaga TaxID=3140254 RepID=A0AAV9UP73_9PEZI
MRKQIFKSKIAAAARASSDAENPVEPESTPPAKKETRGLKAVFAYHDLGPKKLGEIRSVPELKSHMKSGLLYLQTQINADITRVKAYRAPAAETITFSNIDEFVGTAILELEEKPNLTQLRALGPVYMRGIRAIAMDLEEEIVHVTGQANNRAEKLPASSITMGRATRRPFHKRRSASAAASRSNLSGLGAIFGSKSFTARKLGAIKTMPKLKAYIKGELVCLRGHFNMEIEKTKSSGHPLAQEITFSNIDEYIDVAVAGLDTCK